MNRSILFLTTAFLALNAVSAYSQSPERRARSYDPQKVKVTRWLDTTTRPLTYEEWVAGRDFAETQKIVPIRTHLIQTDQVIDIFVNEDLYSSIEGALDTFMADLQLEGYGINLYTANEVLSPVEMRELIYLDWQADDIAGVVLVGDLAIPWYEMYEPQSWGGARVEFPCDLYFMDLDGSWRDADSDGRFDSHSGELLADIWVGRLMPSPLTYHGADEATMLRNYFRKNHLYRIGELRLDDKALAFIDNDWNSYGWGFDVAEAYPQTDSVVDIYETCRDNYISLLRDLSDNRYEHVLVCSQSSSGAHYMYYDSYNYQLFHNYEIESFMMQSFSYNLFACSNSRYVESNNMGGWYTFESAYGLVTVGCTKTGSMLCFEDFYFPLGIGADFGDALLEWSRINMETCAGGDSRAWFYGMVIQGDPTVKLARFQEPITGCQYVLGDFNGNNVMNIADVVAAFSNLRTGWPAPALLCQCPLGSGVEWAVAMDLNGSCGFNIADVVTAFSNLQTGSPPLLSCPDCPPM